jgi:hypothetical protein
MEVDVPRTPKGELYARTSEKWYPAASAPAGARWWFRIMVGGVRRAYSLNTTSKAEAIRRRDAWLAGLRLTSEEAFLQSMVEVGRRAERELARRLAGKGVRPA